MLKIGDTFQHGDLTYKVIGKDAQGRPISTLCDEVPVEDEGKEEEPDKPQGTMKQESLVGDAEPAKKRGRK